MRNETLTHQPGNDVLQPSSEVLIALQKKFSRRKFLQFVALSGVLAGVPIGGEAAKLYADLYAMPELSEEMLKALYLESLQKHPLDFGYIANLLGKNHLESGWESIEAFRDRVRGVTFISTFATLPEIRSPWKKQELHQIFVHAAELGLEVDLRLGAGGTQAHPFDPRYKNDMDKFIDDWALFLLREPGKKRLSFNYEANIYKGNISYAQSPRIAEKMRLTQWERQLQCVYDRIIVPSGGMIALHICFSAAGHSVLTYASHIPDTMQVDGFDIDIYDEPYGLVALKNLLEYVTGKQFLHYVHNNIFAEVATLQKEHPEATINIGEFSSTNPTFVTLLLILFKLFLPDGVKPSSAAFFGIDKATKGEIDFSPTASVLDVLERISIDQR